MNLPTVLTLVRLIIIPIMVAALLVGRAWSDAAALLLLIGAIYTDNLDGRIARRRGLVSPLGGLLDPLADALLFVGLFACFVGRGWMPLWMFALFALRELVMHAFMRPYMLARQVVMKAKLLGKFKTGLQSGVGIGVILFELALWFFPDALAPVKGVMRWTEWGFLLATALLSVGSLYPYAVEVARSRGPRSRAPALDVLLCARLAYAPALLLLLSLPARSAVSSALLATVFFEVSNLFSGRIARRIAPQDHMRVLLLPVSSRIARLCAVLVLLSVRGMDGPAGMALAFLLSGCYLMGAYGRRLVVSGGAPSPPRLSERVASVAQGLFLVAAVGAVLLHYGRPVAPSVPEQLQFLLALGIVCAVSAAAVLDRAVASRQRIKAMARPGPGH